MQKNYFFKDVSNYHDLIKKTKGAMKRNSLVKRSAIINKTIQLSEEEFNDFVSDLRKEHVIIFENIENMYIKQGVWYCICFKAGNKSVLVMSDGYPYPKYCALVNYYF